jgi:hypothetical protein
MSVHFTPYSQAAKQYSPWDRRLIAGGTRIHNTITQDSSQNTGLLSDSLRAERARTLLSNQGCPL